MKTSLVLLFCCLVATTLACRRRSGSSSGSGSGSGSGSVSRREKIARQAAGKRGSTLWSVASSHKTGSGTNKCNIFVAEMIEAAGASLPHRHSWFWSPIGAMEWANPRSSYLVRDRCWTHVYSSSRGDVIAYHGHVGIVTGTRVTTSAASSSVVTNNWGFRVGQHPTFWRYTC